MVLHNAWTYKDIVEIARDKNFRIELYTFQIKRIAGARQVVEKICIGESPIYGINTGVGALAKKIIPKSKLRELQHNIVKSHAVGVGPPLPKDISRAVLFLLINSLTKGRSGVRLELVEFLINLLHKNIIPVIPSKGSLGASGDLAPLAHLAMVVIGEGKVWHQNKIRATKEIFSRYGIKPLRLEAKEGLSLINGTYVMTAMACFNLAKAEILINSADIIGALSLEASKGSLKPFLTDTHVYKPYKGQQESAEIIRRLLKDSGIIKSHCHCGKVQDPYSLRCIPQVHGDSREIFYHAASAINTEINSVTDNPLVISYNNPNDIMADNVLSGGNFHGQRISSVMRYLAGALVNLSAISERRINGLLDGSNTHLPKFLINNNGLHSGLMILQNTAADLVADSKSLSPPAYADSVPVCANQEDYVSMGMSACRRVRDICENTAITLALELLCAAQALEFIKEKPGRGVHQVYKLVRKYIKPVKNDRIMTPDIEKAIKLIKNGRLIEIIK